MHVWTPDTARYPLASGFNVAGMRPPSFTPEQLFTHCRPCGVERVVLIQMSFYRFDNSYMLDTIRRFPGVFRGVAIVDSDADRPQNQMAIWRKTACEASASRPATRRSKPGLARPAWSRCGNVRPNTTWQSARSSTPKSYRPSSGCASGIQPRPRFCADNFSVHEYQRRKPIFPLHLYGWGRACRIISTPKLVRIDWDLRRYASLPWRTAAWPTLAAAPDDGCSSSPNGKRSDLHGIELDPRPPAAGEGTIAVGRFADRRRAPSSLGRYFLRPVSHFTVFSSILNDSVRKQIAAEMLRVAKPGGGVLWFDLRVNNPRNPNVRGVTAARFANCSPIATSACDRSRWRPRSRARSSPCPGSPPWSSKSSRSPCTHYLGIIRKRKP